MSSSSPACSTFHQFSPLPSRFILHFKKIVQKLELLRSSVCFKGVMKYVTVQIIASLQLLLLLHVGECVPLSPGVGVLKLTILLFLAVFLFVKLNSIFQFETVVACTRIFSYNFQNQKLTIFSEITVVIACTKKLQKPMGGQNLKLTVFRKIHSSFMHCKEVRSSSRWEARSSPLNLFLQRLFCGCRMNSQGSKSLEPASSMIMIRLHRRSPFGAKPLTSGCSNLKDVRRRSWDGSGQNLMTSFERNRTRLVSQHSQRSSQNQMGLNIRLEAAVHP